MRVDFKTLSHAERCLSIIKDNLAHSLRELENIKLPVQRIRNAFCVGLGYSSYSELQKLLGADSRPAYVEPDGSILLQALQKGFQLVIPILEELGVQISEHDHDRLKDAVVLTSVRQYLNWRAECRVAKRVPENPFVPGNFNFILTPSETQSILEQLLRTCLFDPSLENANAAIFGSSGSGKSVLAQKMLMQAFSQKMKVACIERGDTYGVMSRYMGSPTITLSSDSPFAVNAFDLPPGETVVSKQHLVFLKSLLLHMVGESDHLDAAILEGVLCDCILRAYQRAQMRLEAEHRVPLLVDVLDDLQVYVDEKHHNKVIENMAHFAAARLQKWTDDPDYAGLFNRRTTVDMNAQCLHFNLEKLISNNTVDAIAPLTVILLYALTTRGDGTNKITVIDEMASHFCVSNALGNTVLQIFRSARRYHAGIWTVNQAIEDYVGLVDNPYSYSLGRAVLMCCSTRFIGRQRGNMENLRTALNLSELEMSSMKRLNSSRVGGKSQFLFSIIHETELHESILDGSVFTNDLQPVEYWLTTSFPRERKYRAWWLKKYDNFHEGIYALAEKYPQGLTLLNDLPEERSGEVERAFL